MLNLVIVNVGNSLRTRISIVVLTLIAWVTIVTSVQMVSYDLQSQRGIVGSRSMVICSVNVARNSTSHRSSSPKNSIASRATSPVSRTAKPTFNCRASSASQPSSASSSFLHTYISDYLGTRISVRVPILSIFLSAERAKITCRTH